MPRPKAKPENLTGEAMQLLRRARTAGILEGQRRAFSAAVDFLRGFDKQVMHSVRISDALLFKYNRVRKRDVAKNTDGLPDLIARLRRRHTRILIAIDETGRYHVRKVLAITRNLDNGDGSYQVVPLASGDTLWRALKDADSPAATAQARARVQHVNRAEKLARRLLPIYRPPKS